MRQNEFCRTEKAASFEGAFTVYTLNAYMSTKHKAYNPPKTECGCLYGGVIGNGRTRNPLTLCSVSICTCTVWVRIPGDPQSVQLRNATTTTAKHTYHL